MYNLYIKNEKILIITLIYSWGSDWGENGYVRIWRGDDELNIESRQATAATAWD